MEYSLILTIQDFVKKKTLGNFLLVAQQTHRPPPSESVRKSNTYVFSTFVHFWGGASPPTLKVYKSPNTSADEALYYSTIYPNSRDLGTAE